MWKQRKRRVKLVEILLYAPMRTVVSKAFSRSRRRSISPRPLARRALAGTDASCGGRASPPAIPWAPHPERGARRGSRSAPAGVLRGGALPRALWQKSVGISYTLNAVHGNHSCEAGHWVP